MLNWWRAMRARDARLKRMRDYRAGFFQALDRRLWPFEHARAPLMNIATVQELRSDSPDFNEGFDKGMHYPLPGMQEDKARIADRMEMAMEVAAVIEQQDGEAHW